MSSQPPRSGPTSRPTLPADCISPSARPCQLRSIICEASPLSVGLTRPLAIAIVAQTASSIGSVGTSGRSARAIAKQEQTRAGQSGFAEYFDQSPDQAALQDDADDPDKSKQITGLARVKAEMLFGKEGEKRRHDGEAGDREKIGGDDRAKHASMTMVKNLRQTGALRAVATGTRERDFPGK